MKKIKNKWLKALAIFGIVAAAWSTNFTIDLILAANNQTPIFCFMISDAEGFPHETYLGLFYKVYVYDSTEGCILDGPPCDFDSYRKVEIHSWFYDGH